MKLSSIATIAFLLLAAAGIAWADNPFIVFHPLAQKELKCSDDQKQQLREKQADFLQKNSFVSKICG